jgi:hypothetical protein
MRRAISFVRWTRCFVFLVGLLIPLAAGTASAVEPNLLLNSHFDEDLSNWTGDSFLTADWDPMDVGGSALSGSALLRNVASSAGFYRGLQQCVEVTPGASYDFGGWVYVAEAQATAGTAFVDLYWTLNPDCSGFLSAGPDSPHVSTEGQWVLTKSEDVTAPPNAQGARIRLAIQKLDAGGEFAAFFDDAFIATTATATPTPTATPTATPTPAAPTVQLLDAELVAAGSPVLQNGTGTVRLEDARLGRLGPIVFVVPEPGALWQLGSGIGLLALFARRRRHRTVSNTPAGTLDCTTPATPRWRMP